MYMSDLQVSHYKITRKHTSMVHTSEIKLFCICMCVYICVCARATWTCVVCVCMCVNDFLPIFLENFSHFVCVYEYTLLLHHNSVLHDAVSISKFLV